MSHNFSELANMVYWHGFLLCLARTIEIILMHGHVGSMWVFVRKNKIIKKTETKSKTKKQYMRTKCLAQLELIQPWWLSGFVTSPSRSS